MEKTAGMKWGIYISIAVFALLVVPVLVGAQGGTSGIPPRGGTPVDSNGILPLIRCDTERYPEPCDFADLIDLAKRLINFLIYVIAIPIATLLFMYAGFLYITAAGNTTQVKKATGIFKNVAGGFIIALSAWLIVNLVVTTLSDDYEDASDVFKPVQNTQ